MVFTMVRYRRYRRYGRRKSTNVIKMKFQSFMDISTNASSMQVITVSAGGPEILRRLAPQFGAYKYYKIGNISIKLVPASTLPVDPTGLSYEEGEYPTVDPRDQLTPGLMRITNGEDVLEDISSLSDAQQHGIYNNMLLDPRWYKWMLQSGVKRHATPRYWQIGQLHQDKWPGAITNIPGFSALGVPDGTVTEADSYTSDGQQTLLASGSDPHGIFQVGHRGTIGWLPTDGLVTFVPEALTKERFPMLASPPEIGVFTLLIPKMYRTNYYYRMFITETVYFKEPIVNFGIPASNGSIYRPLDVFHSSGYPENLWPYNSSGADFPSITDTGGNYGNS